MANTIEINALECESCSDAIQHADASGEGEAVLLMGKPMVVPQSDCDRLAAAGVEFAYLHDHELKDGRHIIVTVPIN